MESAKAVTIQLTDDGSTVIRKQFDASTGDGGLEEATWIARANHRGVVRLISRIEGPPTNVTEYIPGPTLRTAGLDALAAATILAQVAETLADLHQQSMVHGAVNPDHVLIANGSTDRRVAVLCSPAVGREPVDDACGLGRCIEWLLSDWDSRNIAVSNDWAVLAERLASEPPLDLRRAAHQLASLGPDPSSSAPRSTKLKPQLPRPPIPFVKRMAIGGGALMFVLAAWAVSNRPAELLDGARLQASEGVFVVGGPDDRAVALPSPCPGQPHALHLDVSSGTVWTFDSIDHGVAGKPMTVVPGATTLISEPGDPCPRVWASGPAGQVELDWP